MARILIVEDHRLVSQGLEMMLSMVDDFETVGVVRSGDEAVECARSDKPDVVLMDIDLPNISGIEGVRTIKNTYEKVQILMFTVFEDDEKIFAAIRAGASGYLLKEVDPTEIAGTVTAEAAAGPPTDRPVSGAGPARGGRRPRACPPACTSGRPTAPARAACPKSTSRAR